MPLHAAMLAASCRCSSSAGYPLQAGSPDTCLESAGSSRRGGKPAALCALHAHSYPAEALDKLSCAGHLYSRGNYEQATELARQLVLDTQARKTMAAAARSETETLGWMAAIRRVRDMQYGRAVATFRAHKRCTPTSAAAFGSAAAPGLFGCWVCTVLVQDERLCGPACSPLRRT